MNAFSLQARLPLKDPARRIEPAAGWDELVLPAAQKQTLHEIVVHVRQRNMVYGSRDSAARSSQAPGITDLFSGASGTRKMMAAGVLAKEINSMPYSIKSDV